VEVAGSEREGAGQVGAEEVVSEDRLDPGDERSRELVQLRKGGRRRRSTRGGHLGIQQESRKQPGSP
jgi:hypothetical protein